MAVFAVSFAARGRLERYDFARGGPILKRQDKNLGSALDLGYVAWCYRRMRNRRPDHLST
jgi:hypothetical protein